MAEEFEGDLTGAVFWGADLTGAHFRDVNLTDVTITHALLSRVSIDAMVDHVMINGVDVTAYVNDHDPWYPLRAILRPPTAAAARDTLSVLDAAWATTLATAQALGEPALHESVNGEWSFVQTLRHLVFAMDKWFTAPVLGEAFHPIGMPNSGSVNFPWPGLDLGAAPTVADTLGVRAERMARFGSFLASESAADFDRSVDVLENGPHSLEDCIFTVFEEEFWHLRYAGRDLAQLASSTT